MGNDKLMSLSGMGVPSGRLKTVGTGTAGKPVISAARLGFK